MELVFVSKGEVFCDSHIVAKKFGHKPGYVVNHIKNIIDDLESMEGVNMFTPKCISEEREYRGNKYTAYLMNRDFFSFLVMRFKGKRALIWQANFIAAFNAMEQQLLKEAENKKDPDLIELRLQSKIGRREETDVIKEFVDYATAQGSTKAKWYYAHLTNATYKALGLMVQKKPKLRDTMDLYEISELILAERIARNSLKKYMDLERNYKDIYESVKEDLVAFGSGLRIE